MLRLDADAFVDAVADVPEKPALMLQHLASNRGGVDQDRSDA